MKPNDVRASWRGLSIKYVPQNLNYEYETFEFASKNEEETIRYCKQTLNIILKVKIWFENLKPSKLASQIAKNGNDAWIERLWIDDYNDVALNR